MVKCLHNEASNLEKGDPSFCMDFTMPYIQPSPSRASLVVIVVCDTELHDGKVHQVQSKLASFKLYQLRISSVVVFEAKSAGRNPATSG